jgi:hypothetical protein
MDKIQKNHFPSRLDSDWHDHKTLELDSFNRYKANIDHELKGKKIEFCDEEKNLDFKVLENDEKELYLETFDKNLRMACGVIDKQEYTSNAMFMIKLCKHELLLLKHLLLNQLKEIDTILNMKDKLILRDEIIAENKIEDKIDENEIGWLND